MNVLGFVEGVRSEAGGVGLTGVPHIHRALAERGHRDALAIGGRPMMTARPILRQRLEDVFDTSEESAAGAVSFPAFGRWYYTPGLYTGASAAASRADFITMHSLFSYPVLVGYVLSRRFGTPYGLWPHGVLAPIQRQVGRRKKAVYNPLARRILDSAAVLFFSARGEREEALECGLKAPSVVIPHGIELEQFANLPKRGAFRQKYLNGHSGPMVLYLGRLNVKKGLDLLIDAMRQVVKDIPNARLVIAGGGHPPAFADGVQRWLAAAGLSDAAILTGLLGEEEKLMAFADADVFVLPSAAENFGFSMFEAMASRRAIVCSDTVNYAGEVRDGKAGLVVPRSSEAFAGAISSLLRDPGRRHALAERARALAGNYSWDSCGRRLEIAINCVLAGEQFPSSLSPA
jgi:glycosyltransferase involved in cell wall biosynthesis